ncbi:uncharacterized protein LOC117307133 [Asterias rubens]|uniref:uncharacterized protein LOC117307133 n=1 Tax=Asterias rubens TaxID=7604 RepID=UPI001455052E|nr:uncharacterized protein LOC117307133 [Asterias rubens]
MASAVSAKIHRCGGGYGVEQTNQDEHHLRNHPAASPSQRNFRKSSLKSQKATRRILDGPSMPSGRDPPPSFSTGHVRYNTPEENLPTILITAEDLHLNFPTNDMSASPSPPKSPRQEGVVSPAARPKTASSGRASSGRSSRRAHSAKQSKRPASSRSPGRSKERGGQGDRKGSRERRGKPIPAWSVTELLDDDSTTMGGSETHSEYEMSLSSVQTPTDEQIVEDLEDSFSESDSLRSDDPIRRLIEGPPVDEAEYDTDLEGEFAPDKEMTYDSAGKNIYLMECKQEGVEPACYVVRHLHETTFRMRHRYLSMRTLIPLAKAFRSNTCTETLDLRDNQMEGEGGAIIAYMMRDNCYITKLDVSENQIRSKGASGFGSMLGTNYSLKSLCLSANHLSDKAASLLAEGLKNNCTLTHIDLSHNDMGELAGIHLGSALIENTALLYLDLKWNGVRGKGIIALANSFKVNTSLEVLDLSQNGVCLAGCTALQTALKVNTGLRILDLSSNHINTPGVKKLALGLKKNTTLEALLLGGNPMGDEGVLALMKACPFSTNLKLLSLQEITLTLVVHRKIQEIIDACNLCVLSRDYSGHRRTVAPSHLVAMVDRFILDHQTKILYNCFGIDEQSTCCFSSSDLMKVLIRSGLDLSLEQIDSALQQVGVLQSDKILYRPLLDGLSALKKNPRPSSAEGTS